MLQDLIFRIRALFRRGAVEQELDQELRWHLVHLENKLMQSGMAADEARRQAHLSLGGVEQTKEACRDARGTRLIEDLLQEDSFHGVIIVTVEGTPTDPDTVIVPPGFTICGSMFVVSENGGGLSVKDVRLVKAARL